MDEQPGTQRWRLNRFHGGSYRIPLPPGPPPELTNAQREEEREEEARAEALWGWLHLPSLLRVGVTVMGLALGAVVVMAVLALTSHH
jgi:hypothetical protein